MRDIRIRSQFEAVYLFHRAVADIDKRSGIGITARVLTAGMFVEQGYFAPSVVEEAGQAGMIDLGAVCLVCKFEVETSRIEVLIDACGVEPMVVDGS